MVDRFRVERLAPLSRPCVAYWATKGGAGTQEVEYLTSRVNGEEYPKQALLLKFLDAEIYLKNMTLSFANVKFKASRLESTKGLY